MAATRLHTPPRSHALPGRGLGNGHLLELDDDGLIPGSVVAAREEDVDGLGRLHARCMCVRGFKRRRS